MMKSLKQFFGPIDMTVGKPWKSIVMFSIPMIIGNIAQQLYSTVDSIVVGQYVGDNALAAVGSAMPIFNLLLVLLMKQRRLLCYYNFLKVNLLLLS